MAKSSKSAKSERQKLIDDALKKQRSAEQRSGRMIVGVCVLIAVALVVAAAYRPVKDWWDLRHYEGLDLASVGASPSVCQKVVSREGKGVSDHVEQGVHVDYDYAPPAFGAHWNVAAFAPAPFTKKFYPWDDNYNPDEYTGSTSNDARPPLEALVHNLEHGYTILWYDKTIADDSGQMSQIRAIAKKFEADDENLRLKFIAAPWYASDAKNSVKGDPSFPNGEHIAFTHWKAESVNSADYSQDTSTGLWQYCSEVSGKALKTFMTDYPYTDAPEPGAM